MSANSFILSENTREFLLIGTFCWGRLQAPTVRGKQGIIFKINISLHMFTHHVCCSYECSEENQPFLLVCVVKNQSVY
jgi:hypothetical protein